MNSIVILYIMYNFITLLRPMTNRWAIRTKAAHSRNPVPPTFGRCGQAEPGDTLVPPTFGRCGQAEPGDTLVPPTFGRCGQAEPGDTLVPPTFGRCARQSLVIRCLCLEAVSSRSHKEGYRINLSLSLRTVLKARFCPSNCSKKPSGRLSRTGVNYFVIYSEPPIATKLALRRSFPDKRQDKQLRSEQDLRGQCKC